jgi:hypothetical protein
MFIYLFINRPNLSKPIQVVVLSVLKYLTYLESQVANWLQDISVAILRFQDGDAVKENMLEFENFDFVWGLDSGYDLVPEGLEAG